MHRHFVDDANAVLGALPHRVARHIRAIASQDETVRLAKGILGIGFIHIVFGPSLDVGRHQGSQPDLGKVGEAVRRRQCTQLGRRIGTELHRPLNQIRPEATLHEPRADIVGDRCRCMQSGVSRATPRRPVDQREEGGSVNGNGRQLEAAEHTRPERGETRNRTTCTQHLGRRRVRAIEAPRQLQGRKPPQAATPSRRPLGQRQDRIPVPHLALPT